MNSFKTLLTIFILLFVVSCSDDDDSSNIQYYEVSSEFKSYALFDDGSTWTYKKQGTGETAVTSIDSTLSYMGVNGLDDDLSDYKYDAYEQFIHQPNPLNFRKWEVSATNQTEINSKMTSLLRLFFTDRYYIVLQPNYYFGDTIHLGKNEGDYVNVEFLPQFTVGEHNFSSVYHSKTYDSLNEPRTLDFYVAKNYGIIRQEIRTQNDSIIWNLTSWEINQ